MIFELCCSRKSPSPVPMLSFPVNWTLCTEVLYVGLELKKYETIICHHVHHLFICYRTDFASLFPLQVCYPVAFSQGPGCVRLRNHTPCIHIYLIAPLLLRQCLGEWENVVIRTNHTHALNVGSDTVGRKAWISISVRNAERTLNSTALFVTTGRSKKAILFLTFGIGMRKTCPLRNCSQRSNLMNNFLSPVKQAVKVLYLLLKSCLTNALLYCGWKHNVCDLVFATNNVGKHNSGNKTLLLYYFQLPSCYFFIHPSTFMLKSSLS